MEKLALFLRFPSIFFTWLQRIRLFFVFFNDQTVLNSSRSPHNALHCPSHMRKNCTKVLQGGGGGGGVEKQLLLFCSVRTLSFIDALKQQYDQAHQPQQAWLMSAYSV